MKRSLGLLVVMALIIQIFAGIAVSAEETVESPVFCFDRNQITMTVGEQVTIQDMLVNTTGNRALWISREGTAARYAASEDGNENYIIADAAGTTILTVKSPTGPVATLTVNVKAADTTMKLNRPHIVGQAGDKFQLSVLNSGDQTVTWSSNSANVTVDQTGLVSIVTNGRYNAIITATVGETVLTCSVTVTHLSNTAVSHITHYVTNKNDREQLFHSGYVSATGTYIRLLDVYDASRGWHDQYYSYGETGTARGIRGVGTNWAILAYRAPYTGTLGIYLNSGIALNSTFGAFKILKGDLSKAQEYTTNCTKIYPTDKDYITLSDLEKIQVNEADYCYALPGLTSSTPDNVDKFADGLKVSVKAGEYIYIMVQGNSSTTGLYTKNRGFEFKYDDFATAKEKYIEMTENVSLDVKTNTTATVAVGETIGVSSYKYYSTNANVATVDETTGAVTAVGGGECYVYALGDSGVADKCAVTVQGEFTVSALADGTVTVTTLPDVADKAVVLVAVKNSDGIFQRLYSSESKTISDTEETEFEVTDIVVNDGEEAFVYIWDSITSVIPLDTVTNLN